MKFGLLVQLIKTVLVEMFSFLIYLQLWIICLALIYKVAGIEAKDRTGFDDNSYYNFYMLVWSNSIGNINDPEFSHVKEHWEVVLVWAVWYFNQLFIFIILLNFLIAVIGQSYENVMNNAIEFQYNNKATLNSEAHQLIKCITYFSPNFIKSYIDVILVTIPEE